MNNKICLFESAESGAFDWIAYAILADDECPAFFEASSVCIVVGRSDNLATGGQPLSHCSVIDAFGSFVLLPIGFALAGWAADLLGAPRVFLIGSLGVMILVLLGLSHPAIRNLD